MNLRNIIREELRALLFGGDESAREPEARQQTTVADVAEPSETATRQTPRRRRRIAPSVGYWLNPNVDKRTAKKAAADVLAHNPSAVLLAVIANPGKTNRQLVELLADEVPAGKKAIESALDMLRTIDADGNQLERGSRAQKAKALVVSKPLD